MRVGWYAPRRRSDARLDLAGVDGLCEPHGLHPGGPPSLLAAGVGGGRGVCRAAAALWRPQGSHLQTKPTLGGEMIAPMHHSGACECMGDL